MRGDSDADNPSDIDGNGDIDTRTTPSDRSTADADNDGPTPESYRYPDGDDRSVLAGGRAPSPSQKRAIATLVERYFALGLRGDEDAACSLLYPPLSASVAKDYGQGGPDYIHGSTCAEVMAKLFAHYRAQLSVPVRVMAVRIAHRDQADAVIASRAMPASEIMLERVGSRWTIGEIFAQLLP